MEDMKQERQKKRTNVTDKLTTVTEKKDDYVYNYITQSQAADLSPKYVQ